MIFFFETFAGRNFNELVVFHFVNHMVFWVFLICLFSLCGNVFIAREEDYITIIVDWCLTYVCYVAEKCFLWPLLFALGEALDESTVHNLKDHFLQPFYCLSSCIVLNRTVCGALSLIFLRASAIWEFYNIYQKLALEAKDKDILLLLTSDFPCS
jgi:hypothetical protein